MRASILCDHLLLCALNIGRLLRDGQCCFFWWLEITGWISRR